jgi:hypothetical protein
MLPSLGLDYDISTPHQVYVIIGETSEELDIDGNPLVNPANLQMGVNYVVEEEDATTVAAREKVQLSADEWATIRAAINGIENIPSNAFRNAWMGYQYTLHRQGRRLQ